MNKSKYYLLSDESVSNCAMMEALFSFPQRKCTAAESLGLFAFSSFDSSDDF